MKVHLIKAIFYDEGVPDGGVTYCGLRKFSEELMENGLTENISKATCKKCLNGYKKEETLIEKHLKEIKNLN